MGYETQLGRVIRIIWAVFGLSLLSIVVLHLLHDSNPVQDILFLLSTVLIMSGVIIRFKPVTFGGIGLLIFTIYTYYVPDINFLLVNVVGITFGMLIPGLALYLLKKDE